MSTIEVVVAETACAGKVDELISRVPELVEGWTNQLTACESAGQTLLELPSFELSAKNSNNFQVIGMLYKVIYEFQREHELPEIVRILCDSKATAKMYRQIYNFYIAPTKADRLNDGDWD